MTKIHIKKEDISHLNHVQVIGKLIKYYWSEISANLSKFTSHNCSYVVLILKISEWLIWLYYLLHYFNMLDFWWNMKHVFTRWEWGWTDPPAERGTHKWRQLKWQAKSTLQELAVALLPGRDKALPSSHLLINSRHWEIRGKTEGEHTLHTIVQGWNFCNLRSSAVRKK